MTKAAAPLGERDVNVQSAPKVKSTASFTA